MSDVKYAADLPSGLDLNALIGLNAAGQMMSFKPSSFVLIKALMKCLFESSVQVKSLDEVTDAGIYRFHGDCTDKLPDGTSMAYGKLIQLGANNADRSQLFLGFNSQRVAYRYITNSGTTKDFVILNP